MCSGMTMALVIGSIEPIACTARVRGDSALSLAPGRGAFSVMRQSFPKPWIGALLPRAFLAGIGDFPVFYRSLMSRGMLRLTV